MPTAALLTPVLSSHPHTKKRNLSQMHQLTVIKHNYNFVLFNAMQFISFHYARTQRVSDKRISFIPLFVIAFTEGIVLSLFTHI